MYFRKFQCLTVNPRNIDSNKQTVALQIEDQIITNALQIKLPGVEINDKLDFTNRISNICIKWRVGVEELFKQKSTSDSLRKSDVILIPLLLIRLAMENIH